VADRFPHPADGGASTPPAAEAARNVGHGHVFPRPDGRRARCGGPALCPDCTSDAAKRDGLAETLRGGLRAALAARTLSGARERVSAALDLLADASPPPPPEPLDLRVHSPACGLHDHAHGPACHASCPVCGGRDL
jgi:hypothetical protein